MVAQLPTCLPLRNLWKLETGRRRTKRTVVRCLGGGSFGKMKTKNKLYHYSAEVTRVVDGDTVDAFVDLGFDMHSKQRVRLYGINTPECRTRDKIEKVAGLAAKARLQEMLKENKNKCVIKTSLDKKGKYGRVLGVLYVEDVNLNETLVEEGHADEYFGGSR